MLVGFGLADVEDETLLAPADVPPGKDFLQVNLFAGGRKQIAGAEHAEEVNKGNSFEDSEQFI